LEGTDIKKSDWLAYEIALALEQDLKIMIDCGLFNKHKKSLIEELISQMQPEFCYRFSSGFNYIPHLDIDLSFEK